MAGRSPFLSLDDRVSYLSAKHYFSRDSFTGEDIAQIGRMNFHYFLGYARNFRQLFDQGLLIGEKTPHQVLEIIDLDAQISTLLYRGIRNSEWLLRHYIVQAYCQKFGEEQRFLDFSSFLETGEEYTNQKLSIGLLNDILEYGENYVVRGITSASQSLGVDKPRRCTASNFDLCMSVTADLPLWSVVDSFSLGRLVKFIQRCDNTEDAKNHIWRDVAQHMGIPANRFQPGIDSLRSLRNLISHQSRLWMRPTTNTPQKQGLFRKDLDRCHRKSAIITYFNVASFQGDQDASLAFGHELRELISMNENYLFGVSHFGKNIVEF